MDLVATQDRSRELRKYLRLPFTEKDSFWRPKVFASNFLWLGLLAIVAVLIVSVNLFSSIDNLDGAFGDSLAAGNVQALQRESYTFALEIQNFHDGVTSAKELKVREAMLRRRLSVRNQDGTSNFNYIPTEFSEGLDALTLCIEPYLLRESKLFPACTPQFRYFIDQSRQLESAIDELAEDQLGVVVERQGLWALIYIVVSIALPAAGIFAFVRSRRTALDSEAKLKAELEDRSSELRNINALIELQIANAEAQAKYNRSLSARERFLAANLSALTQRISVCNDEKDIQVETAIALRQAQEYRIVFMSFYGEPALHLLFTDQHDRPTRIESPLLAMSQADMLALQKFLYEPDGTIVDYWPDGRLAAVLPRQTAEVRRLFGMSLDELKGNEKHRVVPFGDRGELFGVLLLVEGEHTKRHPQELAFLHRVSSAVSIELGRVRRQKIRDELDKSHQLIGELRELDRLQTEFIAQVNHELRTPLTLILGFTELLTDSQEVPSSLKTHVEAIGRNAQRLLHTVEAMLETGRPTGGENLNVVPVDVASVLNDISRQHSASNVVPEIAIVQKTDFTTILSDKDKIVTIFSNLVSNAVKYNKNFNTIRISIESVGGDDARFVRVAVADQGLGIPAAELPFIFDRFYRGTSISKLAVPGTGLGLAIVQKLVVEVGGEIYVQSNEGVGTTFTVELPMIPLQKSDASKAHQLA